jgi:hypothetical protein
MVLIADDGDRSRVLGTAQLLRGSRGSQPAPDDDDAPTSSHVEFLHDERINKYATLRL